MLALEGAVGFLGYEFIHQLEKWGSAVLSVLFVILSVKILQHGNLPMRGTVHGGAEVGAFVLMTTIAFSGSFSWASYAAHYSRYQPRDTPRAPLLLLTLAGLVASFIWMYAIGLAGAKTLTDQTAAGVQALMGGGALGVLALVAIVVGAITSNAMNDYSGSLAIQAGGIRLRRNLSALVGTVFAFFLILWIHGGDTSTRFQNILLFSAYWIAPFLAVLVIDWHYVRSSLNPARLLQLMDFHRLVSGWSALLALVVGFGAMLPFMNTGLLVGPAASALDGADISFYVGFVVAALVYFPLRRLEARRSSESFEPLGSHELGMSGTG